jgi:hypothetical protein
MVTELRRKGNRATHPIPQLNNQTNIMIVQSKAMRSWVQGLVGYDAVRCAHDGVRCSVFRLGREQEGKKRVRAEAVGWCRLEGFQARHRGLSLMYSRHAAQAA